MRVFACSHSSQIFVAPTAAAIFRVAFILISTCGGVATVQGRLLNESAVQLSGYNICLFPSTVHQLSDV